jgi:hypothetical protein
MNRTLLQILYSALARTWPRGVHDLAIGCAYRKSHPAILMVQSAQDRAADDTPGPLNAARDRGILVQGQMSARDVVVIFVRQQNVAQMAFAEDYDMINAFPPD